MKTLETVLADLCKAGTISFEAVSKSSKVDEAASHCTPAAGANAGAYAKDRDKSFEFWALKFELKEEMQESI